MKIANAVSISAESFYPWQFAKSFNVIPPEGFLGTLIGLLCVALFVFVANVCVVYIILLTNANPRGFSLFVCLISLTSCHLITELFPDCLKVMLFAHFTPQGQ